MTRGLLPALGTMTLSGGYGRIDQELAFSVLSHAVKCGVALLDTASAYVGGEVLVASVLASMPDRPVRVVTKVGLTGRPGQRIVCGRPGDLVRACDLSLQRLGGDQLDIVLLHRVDREVPVEESMAALSALMGAGKVAEIGVCTNDPDLLRRAASEGPIKYVQAPLSVLAPAAAGDLLPAAREVGATMLAASPLARGLVALDREQGGFGVDDARAHVPEIDQRRSLALDFRRLAETLGVSAVDLALGWLTSHGPDVVPIPGARSMKQVTSNLEAQRQALSAEQLLAVTDFVRATGSRGRAKP